MPISREARLGSLLTDSSMDDEQTPYLASIARTSAARRAIVSSVYSRRIGVAMIATFPVGI